MPATDDMPWVCPYCDSPLPLLPFHYGCDVCCPDDVKEELEA